MFREIRERCFKLWFRVWYGSVAVFSILAVFINARYNLAKLGKSLAKHHLLEEMCCWSFVLGMVPCLGWADGGVSQGPILGAFLAVIACAEAILACMQWTWGLRGTDFQSMCGVGIVNISMILLYVYIHGTCCAHALEISAAENAARVGNVCCLCSHGTEEGPHEIEPFGKVCRLDLIFLLGHSCLGLRLLLAQVTALVCWKQRLQPW